MNESPTTVMVETARGVLVREIPGASPLRSDIARGKAAEEATHDAAALWGLADFVHRPSVLHLGSGTRELGDGLLIVGSLGVVVQVKTRDAASDDEAKEGPVEEG